MNINELTIGQAKELVALFGSTACIKPTSINRDLKPHPYTGKKVLIRTYASGVHIGTLKDYDSSTRSIFLSGSQRIHQWSGAFTLSKVATKGITGGRISCINPEIYIEQVEEITLISDEAIDSISKLGIHNE